MAESAPTYLILGGTTKAATTSVFTYLRDHPEVCGATLKETRYFLDTEYPLPIPRSYREGAGNYERYFDPCAGRPVRVEATPDYLYSEETPDALRRHLSDVRCVFILRDPVDRLVSWYRFARQNGQLPSDCSFETYVSQQLDGTAPSGQPWRAVEQGRYARYLRPYIDVLGRNRVETLFFEEVTGRPREALRRIASFAGIDADFYDAYTFRVRNRTRDVRSARLHAAYRWLLRTVRYRVHQWPWLHSALRRLRAWIDPLYYAFAARTDEPTVDVPPALRGRLRRYYAGDVKALTALLNETPPWPTSAASRSNATRFNSSLP